MRKLVTPLLFLTMCLGSLVDSHPRFPPAPVAGG